MSALREQFVLFVELFSSLVCILGALMLHMNLLSSAPRFSVFFFSSLSLWIRVGRFAESAELSPLRCTVEEVSSLARGA